MTTPKYPEVRVKLIGKDGNAFAILGQVQKALRKHRIPQEEINQYLKEAMSGDYDNLLATTMKWVEVE